MRKIATAAPLLVLSMIALPAIAAVTKLATSAGLVEVSRNEATNLCSVTWKGKALSAWACEYEYDPNVLRHVKQVSGGYDEVLVIQKSPQGNACNGGRILVFGVDNGSAVQEVGQIDYCGGPTPSVSATSSVLKISWPDAPPNRGSGIVPGEVWAVEKRVLRKLK